MPPINNPRVDAEGLALPSATPGQASVTTSAAQLIAANPGRGSVSIFNSGTATIYLGIDNTVSSANGFPIPANSAFTVESVVAVWAVAASGSQDVRLWEESRS